MPMSGKERWKKWHKNLNEEDKATFKLKDSLRKKNERAILKAKMTPATLEKNRKKRAEQQKIYRQKMKQKKANTETCNNQKIVPSFGSPQAFGKAKRRAEIGLPKSPNKKQKVLTALISDLSPSKKTQIINEIRKPHQAKILTLAPRRKRSDALPEENIKMVENFYLREDISRTLPGKKDCISVKTSIGREKRQKKLLIMTINEAYEVFKIENPELKIGLSKFYEIRPPQVFVTSSKNHEVCLCKYHENVAMLLIGLRKVVPELPSSSQKLVEATVCSMQNPNCIDRVCNECGCSNLNEFFDDVDEYLILKYYQWQMVGGEMGKVMIESSLSEAKAELEVQLFKFSRHIYNEKRQHKELIYLRENLPNGHIILHEDFSENYQIKHQREVMQAHWSTNSITIFTAVIYYRDEVSNKVLPRSYAVASDQISHDKVAVCAFNKLIVANFKEFYAAPIKHIHYWSDGAGSQFKNKYIFVQLVYHMEDFSCTADWSYFETAHGKGAVDGVGGEVKRMVWLDVLRGQSVVVDVESFVKVAQQKSKKIQIILGKKEKIVELTDGLQQRWEKALPLPQTHNVHYVKSVNKSIIEVSKNSSFCQQALPHDVTKHVIVKGQIEEQSSSSVETSSNSEANFVPTITCIIPGDFIIVKYSLRKSDRFYLGQVSSKDEEQKLIEVVFLRKADGQGKMFHFPEKEDRDWIQDCQISQKLPTPQLDNRGRFLFDVNVLVTD